MERGERIGARIVGIERGGGGGEIGGGGGGPVGRPLVGGVRRGWREPRRGVAEAGEELALATPDIDYLWVQLRLLA